MWALQLYQVSQLSHAIFVVCLFFQDKAAANTRHQSYSLIEIASTGHCSGVRSSGYGTQAAQKAVPESNSGAMNEEGAAEYRLKQNTAALNGSFFT